MKHIDPPSLNVDERVREAINESMLIYCNKLSQGKINVGLEATFQHELALILRSVLEQKTLKNSEMFSLMLEQNVPINGINNYVDIVVHYEDGTKKTNYLIELKFKKETDSAADLGVVSTYFDLYNLDLLHYRYNPGNVGNCYAIFLTDLKTYINAPRATGTRHELPMYDGADIFVGTTYMASTNSAKNKILKQFGSDFKGFTFTKNLHFDYNNFKANGDDYWYFIQEI